MTSGTCEALDRLPGPARSLLSRAPRAVLGTLDDGGRPHLVPVTFAVASGELVTAVDHKPKRTTALARLRHIRARPKATMLIDYYSDDWNELAWIMVRGRARIEPAGTADDALAARYSQYVERPPEGPVIVVTPEVITWWRAAG